MLKESTIALLALVSLAGSANAGVPRYRGPNALQTPIQNIAYISTSSPIPGTNFTDNGVIGAQARFVSGVSLPTINMPALNTAYDGWSSRKLVASFACGWGTQAAIEVGVMKGVVPAAAASSWVHVDGMNAATPRQAYSGYYILYTTAGQQYLTALTGVPTPSTQANVYQQVSVIKSGPGWNVRIWDVATAQNLLNATLGPATCKNAAGVDYNPGFIHEAWAGAELNSSNPAITPSNTIDNSQYRYENFGLWSANNVFNGSLPNFFVIHNTGWLGSKIGGYLYNPPAANNAVNRLLAGIVAPNPNITPVPVTRPVPCGLGTSTPCP